MKQMAFFKFVCVQKTLNKNIRITVLNTKQIKISF